jgi:phosphoglycolate phosphatase
MNRPADILFDLDGTLIDSSPGILASFKRVLDANGLQAAVPLEASLIGPPLGETLQRISGIADEAVLARLIEAFKQDYDTVGYRQTFAFAGVPEGLRRLAESGARLFIVTNKRMVPTRKILDALDLARYFTGVHTRDESVPMSPSKSAVTRRVVAQYAIAPGNALFVGDSEEDRRAATENGMAFVHAAYGYGDLSSAAPAAFSTLARLTDLPALAATLLSGAHT